MLLPGASSPSQVAALYCVPWNPADNLESLYDETALQFNTDSDPSLAAIIKVALQNQMMLYRKASCTDCATAGLPPTQTVINYGSTSIQRGVPPGIVQTNITDQSILNAEGVAGQGVSELSQFAQAGSKLASALPVIGIVANVITDITGIFTAAHAAAVAREQAVNCSVAYAFNKYIPQYDYAVATGQMSAEAALSAVTQIIQDQLLPALSEVTSAHNWGWSAGQVLQAHLYFRQKWYSTLEANPLASSASGVLGSLTGSLTANPILLIAVAAGAVILLGRKRA